MDEQGSSIYYSNVEYFEYMEGNKHSRRIYEGEAVLNAGHIILCGQVLTQDNTISIYALCVQSSSPQANPHVITGTFVVTGTRARVRHITCSCKAGDGSRCKHISAVLLKCTRLPLDALEKLSQTDIKCTWAMNKASVKEQYSAVPIEEMPCFKNKYNKVDLLSDDIRGNIRSNFIKNLPNSSLALHSIGRHQLIEKDEEHGVLNILFNNMHQSVLMMEISGLPVNIQQCCLSFMESSLDEDYCKVATETKLSKNDWCKSRKYRITGSRVYEIYTYAGIDWSAKCNKYFNPKHFTNKYTQHGIKFEEHARNEIVKVKGFKVVQFGFLLSPFNCWMGFSPDGIIFENNEPKALLEIKCPFLGKTRGVEDVLPELPYLTSSHDGAITLAKRHTYYGQIQMGMAVLNLPKCYFVVYCSHDQSLFTIEIEYDYNFAKDMLSVVKQKYFKYMIHYICNNNS